MENEIQINNPASLIELAIQKDADIEKLSKLMDLQERWETRQSAKAFKIAMSSFTSNKPELKKNKQVSFNSTNYKYLPLGQIQKAIDPVLGGFGLSYRWEQSTENNLITITCIVSHVDGHTENTFMSAPADDSGKKNKIQSIGSAVSYLKRYTLEGALGLSSDYDDDGKGVEQIKQLPTLSPEAGGWDKIKEKAIEKNTSIEDLRKHYKITDADYKLLLAD